jgi:hypothetical protein
MLETSRAAGVVLVAAAGLAVAAPVRAQTPAVRLYGGVEYLLWSVKDAPLAVPLLATGPDEEPSVGGFLRAPESRVLYGAGHAPAAGGKSYQALPLFSGSRVTLGYWLDDARTTAVEGSGFLLERRGKGYTGFGDASGNPPMRIPTYNNVPYRAGGVGLVVPPLEDGVPVALPDDLSGRASFNNYLQFWGADAAAVKTLYRGPNFEVSGIAGIRYLHLAEQFRLRLGITGFLNSPYAGESGTTGDDFKTDNQFFGGQIGVRGRYVWGRLSAEGTAKLGLGLSHETQDITGSFVEFNTPVVVAGPPGVTNGLRPAFGGPNGIFAQPSNEGRRSIDQFAFVPELQVKLGYDLTDWARVTIGYDFIYYSNVLRPTDQIDRSFSKGLPFQQDPASTTGPKQKTRVSDFYAHGLNLGVSFRF